MKRRLCLVLLTGLGLGMLQAVPGLAEERKSLSPPDSPAGDPGGPGRVGRKPASTPELGGVRGPRVDDLRLEGDEDLPDGQEDC